MSQAGKRRSQRRKGEERRGEEGFVGKRAHPKKGEGGFRPKKVEEGLMRQAGERPSKAGQPPKKDEEGSKTWQTNRTPQHRTVSARGPLGVTRCTSGCAAPRSEARLSPGSLRPQPEGVGAPSRGTLPLKRSASSRGESS